MLAKKNLKGLFCAGLITGLVFSATLLGTGMPARAQVESLEEQLTEAKAITAEQATIIRELNKTVGSLEATNAEQAQTIKQLTDTYFRTTGQLESKLDSLTVWNASLEATNAGQAETIKGITDNYFKVTGELGHKVASLERVNTKQKEQIVSLKLKIWDLELEITGAQTTTLFLGVGGLIAGYALGGGFK